MYQSSQQPDHNRLNKYIPPTSPKYKSTAHPMIVSLQRLNNLQQMRFEQIQKGCTFLQTYLTSMEQLVEKLEDRIHEMQEMRSTQTISNLKQKQNEFIIHELKEKIKKSEKNQQNLEIEVKHLKKQLQNMKRLDKEKDTHKLDSSKLKQSLCSLEKSINQKDDEIQQLNAKISRLLTDKKQDKKQHAGSADRYKKDREEQFRSLQGKLFQLQKEFDGKVTSLQQEVREKNTFIKKLEQQLEKKQKQMEYKEKQFQIQLKSVENMTIYKSQSQQVPSTMLMTFNPARKLALSTQSQPQLQQSSAYQLQLKLTHQQTLYKQLEQQYTSHLTQSNNLQIQLHQQIHQQKLQLQEEKKKYKSQKKKIITLLQSLASFINKRSFNYFDASSEVQSIIQQVKKIFTNQKQKWDKQLSQTKQNEKQQQQKLTQLQRDNRKNRNQNNLLKQQIQNYKQQLQRLLAQKEKDKQKEKKLKRQNSIITQSNNNNSQLQAKRPSLNGSLGQISNTKSQSTSLLQQKYKSIIQGLRLQLQQKQQHITELQSLQSTDFQKTKQKILSIQSQLADSRNEVKKLQRQLKQLKQKSNEQTKQSQSLRVSLQQVKQKHIKQKEHLQSQQQLKLKSLDQKLSKLKEQNQHIDSKCQQKVMKYNKLKTKLQKLQMYNSQTEKRKDTQIQQLIKKNQQLKMECKLLQEKINIAQALQLNTPTDGQQQNGHKNTYVYNKDLIEQIQMQRDRILQQYQNKRRQCIKSKQLNQNLQEEKLKIQQELSFKQQQKLKLQQERIKLQQQKQKLQQQKLKLNQQSQKTTTKLSQEKQSISVQLSQLKKQLLQQKQQRQSLSKQLSRLQQEQSTKSKQQYQHLKKQLQSQLQQRKKLQKQQQALVERIKQLKQQNQKLKKDMQEKAKSLQTRWQEKYKEKTSHHQQQMSKLKDEHQAKIKDMQQKLSQAQIRQENLVNIINYKNMSMSGTVRESMRGEEEEVFEQFKQYELHEKLAIPQIKQIHFGQTFDQQSNTEDVRDSFIIYSLQGISIKPTPFFPLLTIQTLPIISIQSQTKYATQQTSANIFDQQQQLLKYLKQKHPSVLQSIVNQLRPNKVQKINSQPIVAEVKQIKQTTQIGVNTQHQHRPSERKSIEKQINNNNRQSISNRQSITNRESISNRQSINNKESIKSGIKQNSFILQKDWLGSDEPSHSSVQQTPIPQSNGLIPAHVSARQKFNIQSNKIEQINLFQNLKPSNFNLQIGDQQNIDDNFQICQQGQSINVGRTALNLQIKEIFNKLREQLQKVFNGQEISLSMIKILPRQLEDDYNQFIAYVRQKISQIKVQNQLSFIMAQVGDEPQQIDQQLDQQLKTFIDKKISQDMFTYKKLAEQKQALITSLLNQRTMQQNTINQMTMEKEQNEEEHQNRFMNQCNIYKREIKQLKNKVDNLEMNFQSLKNIFKNTMEIWVDQMENQDDLRDNFGLYKKIAKLTQLQSTRLNYYIFRYKEIKNITD